MIIKKIMLMLYFVFFVYGSVFSQGHGTIVSPFTLGGDFAGDDRSIGNIDNFNFSIKTNNEHRIHINANGFVGIGTTTPTSLLECSGQVKITGGNPGLNKVLTSNADGLASWTLPAGGGFTDAGATIILTNINDNVGIGESGPDSKFHVTDGGSAGTVTATANTIVTLESPGNGYLSILTPNANERGIFFGEPSSPIAGGIIYNNSSTLDGFQFKTLNNTVRMVIEGGGNVGIGTTSPTVELEVVGNPGSSVGGSPSGQFQVRGSLTTVNSNSVITGHNSFNGNTQLWYLGSVSSSNQNIAFINRQNAELHFHTNDLNRFTIQAGGNIGIGATAPTVLLAIGNNNTGFTANVNDLDLITASGGVFKFILDAFRSGQDASNYLEIGHGGSNSFLNQVGAGGMDFRFAGTTKATFTVAGHLHLLTDTDQKHTLKIKTANNLNDTGMAWENSGGAFTHTIFRTDVGSNRADLVFAAGINTDIDLLTNSFKIHGEAADEGKLEVIGAFQISSGSPALDRVLTSDASGIATWTLPVKLQRIEGNFSGLNTQVPATTTPIVLTFESNDIPLQGITHSETVNPGEFTADIAATYTWQVAPQWEKTTASGTDTLDFFIQLDTGSGFVKTTNSNVKVIRDSKASGVIFLSASVPMAVGDKIRFMFRSSNPPNLQTTFFAATSDVSETPSQILNVFSGN